MILLASLFAAASPYDTTDPKLLVAYAHQVHQHGSSGLSLQLALTAVEFARGKDPHTLARALNWAGWIYGDLGRPDLALVCLQQARQIGEELGSESIRGLAIQEIGNNLRRLGRLDEAAAAATESVAIARSLGIRDGITEGNAILAEVALVRGDLDGAEALLLEAEQVAVEMGYGLAACVARETMGRVYLRGEAPDAARVAFSNALETAREHELPRCEAAALTGLARVEPDAERAWTRVEEALVVYERTESEAEAAAWAVAGATLLELQELERAQQSLAYALDLLRQANTTLGDTLTEQAVLAGLVGEEAAAVRLALDALDAYQSAGDLDRLWALHLAVGESWEAAGRPGEALAHYRSALDALDALPPVATFPEEKEQRREATVGLLERIQALERPGWGG